MVFLQGNFPDFSIDELRSKMRIVEIPLLNLDSVHQAQLPTVSNFALGNNESVLRLRSDPESQTSQVISSRCSHRFEG